MFVSAAMFNYSHEDFQAMQCNNQQTQHGGQTESLWDSNNRRHTLELRVKLSAQKWTFKSDAL